MTGLGSAGATVIIERYVDANGNGIIDAGEFLVERFTVTDGQVSTIGGVRNTHVPGDDDGTADSQISLNLIPAHGAEFGQLAGAQLIRISSPTDAFTSFTRSLTLTQPALGQQLAGPQQRGVEVRATAELPRHKLQ